MGMDKKNHGTNTRFLNMIFIIIILYMPVRKIKATYNDSEQYGFWKRFSFIDD